jgi:type II secretory pathway component GspD/PulD (secretin)
LVLIDSVIGGPDMPGMVTIQARFAEMPEDVLSKTGLDWMKSGTRESSSQSILDSEESAHLVATLENSQGVNVLSAPKVSALDGRQAQIKTVNLRTFGPGETHELGPVVDLVPHLSTDGRSVDLTVIARLKIESTRDR